MRILTMLTPILIVSALSACAPADSPPAEDPDGVGLENGSFMVELNDFDIHYEVHGQGPVVLVVPNSWGLSLAGLRGIFGSLEQKLTLIYFDPRGMGGSSEIRHEADMGLAAVREDFQALREHIGIESANAIGWSNGATNLVLLAAERPETIASAVILHGMASYTKKDMIALAARYPEMIEASTAFNQEMENPKLTADDKTKKMRAMWLEQWFPMSFADRAIASETLERIFRDAEFSWSHADYSQRAYPTIDLRDQLPAITARCLVISGAHDMMPASKGEDLTEGIPNARFVLFEKSGHYAPAEEPQAFEDLIFSFFGVN